jgi:hypothetical protein
MLLFGALLLTLPDGERPVDATLITGVAAFLIAMLPIREVLVPSELSGFTFVDYAIGTEMAVMVAATLVVARAAGRRRPASTERSPSTDG